MGWPGDSPPIVSVIRRHLSLVWASQKPDQDRRLGIIRVRPNVSGAHPRGEDFAISPLGFATCERDDDRQYSRSEEHTSELQSLMRISYAVFCLKKKKRKRT